MTEFDIQGIPVSKLAAEYGTPLFLYDGSIIASQVSALRKHLHPALEIFFSLKANPNITICALLRSFGVHAEVSSLTELVTAERAGVAPENIIFPGPGKSSKELSVAVERGIGAIVCESLGELSMINEIAARLGRAARVAVRVNPAFSVKGAALTMGGKPRQFGIDEEVLFGDSKLLLRFPHVRLVGVHVYMGTRILREDTITQTTGRVLELAGRVSAALSFPLEFVDIGGGFGIAYFEGEEDLDLNVLRKELNPLIEEFVAAHPRTRIVTELGRYLTAPAGCYVVRVRYVKMSRGQRFAIVDGGTHQHMAAIGIGSAVRRNFPIRLLNRLDDEATEEWQVAGPLCTPNDLLGKNILMPSVRPGDLIGVLRSGAYGLSASPILFLGHGGAAEVLVHGGRPYLVRERDYPDDLLARQRLHEFGARAELAADNGRPDEEKSDERREAPHGHKFSPGSYPKPQ